MSEDEYLTRYYANGNPLGVKVISKLKVHNYHHKVHNHNQFSAILSLLTTTH